MSFLIRNTLAARDFPGTIFNPEDDDTDDPFFPTRIPVPIRIFTGLIVAVQLRLRVGCSRTATTCTDR